MQGRGGLAAFFTFLILTVILAFQIRLMVCAERFYVLTGS